MTKHLPAYSQFAVRRRSASWGTRRLRKVLLCAILSLMPLGCALQRDKSPSSREGAKYSQISVGSFAACGLTDGVPRDLVQCWGRKFDDSVNSETLASIETKSVSSLATGGNFACAVIGPRPRGAVVCNGDANLVRHVPDKQDYIQVAAGNHHACALRVSGTVDCWGAPDDILLADHWMITGKGKPPAEQFTFQSLACGGASCCGIRPDDSVQCWGRLALSLPGRFRSVSVGREKVIAVTKDGKKVIQSRSEAQSREVGQGVLQSAVGPGYECDLMMDGHVECSGYLSAEEREFLTAELAELGVAKSLLVDLGEESPETTPPKGYRFKAISAGAGMACGITTEGRAVCWGIDALLRNL